MKHTLKIFFSAFALLLLPGCESMGFNPRGVDEALTPGVSANTTVRTWKKSKDGTPIPVEREVENPQAFE